MSLSLFTRPAKLIHCSNVINSLSEFTDLENVLGFLSLAGRWDQEVLGALVALNNCCSVRISVGNLSACALDSLHLSVRALDETSELVERGLLGSFRV